MAPARPKLAAVAAGGLEFKTFDQYVEEANRVKPFVLRVSDDEAITVECPTSNDLIALSEAQMRQDMVVMANIVFKTDAPRVLELSGTKRFTVLAAIVNDVMVHYGMGGANLPES